MDKTKHMTNGIVAWSLAISLAGCAATPKSTTPAENKLVDQGKGWLSTKAGGCTAGAVLLGGACLGLTLALAPRAAPACIAAAMAGCGIGVATAQYMEEKRKKYADQEQLVSSVIADAQADNRRLEAYVQTEQQVINENLKELGEIEKSYAEKKISLEEAKKKSAHLHEAKKLLEENLEGMRTVAKQWLERQREKELVADARVKQEVESIRNKVVQSNDAIKAYAERLNVSTIG